MKDKDNQVLAICLAFIILCFIGLAMSSCSTTHSFSINADSIEKPQIHYADSLTIQKIF